MSKMPQFPQKEIKPVPPFREYPGGFLNQKYMMPVDRIKQVYNDGNVVGISCDLLVPAYHGYPLSMIHHIRAKYDFLEFTNDPMTLTVEGHTYTFAEMTTMSTLYWEFGEFATLFIPVPGGAGLCQHRLEVYVAFNGNGPRVSETGVVAEFNMLEV